MRKKPRFQTWTTTLPHQIEVEGFKLEPCTTTFPHQIEVEEAGREERTQGCRQGDKQGGKRAGTGNQNRAGR